MTIARGTILGPPWTYHLRLDTVLDQPVFSDAAEQQHFLQLLTQIQTAFQCRIYAWAIAASSVHLVLRHVHDCQDSDRNLRDRWAVCGGRAMVDITRLRQRFSSLGGLMQTLAQRYSQGYHRRHGSRGHFWARRYRACLLADDAAILAAVVVLEHQLPCLHNSRVERATPDAQPVLANLPMRQLPDNSIVPADEVRLGFPHHYPEDELLLLDTYAEELEGALPVYAETLDRSWALGRPESLTASLGRLGRSSGRGRSRSIRELDDDQGLCGLWG